MDMEPMERRMRIYALAEADPEYRKMKAEFDRAKVLFDQFTLNLPEDQRNLLQTYPGMGYLLHHKMLNIICDHLRFPEEDQDNTP